MTSTNTTFPISNTNVLNNSAQINELFEYAITQANQGKTNKAIDIARETLFMAKQSNSYTTVYLHTLMANLHIDLGKTTMARLHIYHALNRLNKNHCEYNTDKDYLTALLNSIDKKEVKLCSLALSEVAA